MEQTGSIFFNKLLQLFELFSVKPDFSIEGDELSSMYMQFLIERNEGMNEYPARVQVCRLKEKRPGKPCSTDAEQDGSPDRHYTAGI